jgi:hypothetical protein
MIKKGKKRKRKREKRSAAEKDQATMRQRMAICATVKPC